MLPTTRRRSMDNPLDLFAGDFNRMLNRWWADSGEEELTGSYPVDINEDEDHYYVEAEMPGFKKNEINVTLENGVLTIQGERKAQEKAKSARHLTERRFTRVSRSFKLPTAVDENKVEAKLDEGVLHLTLHKREEVKPRRIEVK